MADMQSQTLLSKPVVAAVAGALNQNLAEFDSVNNKLSPKMAGAGSTANIYINRPAKVWVGQDEMPEDYKPNQEKVVNIVLENYSDMDWVGITEGTADVISLEEQKFKPLRTGLERRLKRAFFNGMASTCNTVIQAKGQTGIQNSTLAWEDVAMAISRVRDSIVGDGEDISVLLPSTAQAKLLGASATNFWSAKTQDEIFNNRLGKFDGADIITTTIQGSRSTVAIPAIGADAVEGDDSLVLSTATTALIKAGTMFTIAGVYALDLEGNEVLNDDGTPALASFAVPIDVPIGALTLPLGKRLFIDTAPGEVDFAGNIYSNNGTNATANGGNSAVGGGAAFITTLPKADAVITQVNGGKNMFFVYSSLAMGVCSAAPAPIRVQEEHVETRAGVAIRMATQGNLSRGKTEFRMDALCGLSGVYAPGAVAVVF